MKKLILTTVLLISVVSASFYAQVKQMIVPEKTISKNISLKVFAGSDYNSRTYTHSVARVNLTIIKIRKNEMDTLLIKEYPELHLEKFPSLIQAIGQTIHIPKVVDTREQIVISYTITYISKESILKVQSFKFVSKGTSSDQLNIII